MNTEPKKTRKKARFVKNQPKTVDEWIQAKIKFPQSYTVSPEGMLISPAAKPGESEIIITLEPKVLANKEYIQSEFENRKEEIKTAEEQFTEARRSLQRTVDAFRKGVVSAADVVIANQQVKEAESFLISKATDPREITTVSDPNPEVRNILLDQPERKNKVADPVYALKRATFPWKFFYQVRVPEPELPDVQLGEEVKEEEEAPAPPEKTEEEIRAEARRGAIIGATTKKKKRPQVSFNA